MASSFVADVLLAHSDARVEGHRVLLEGDLLLIQNGIFGLQVVDLVDVQLLQLKVVLLEVGDVFDHFFQDVVGGLGGVVLQGSALRPEQLHLLLVFVEELEGGFRTTLALKLAVTNGLHRQR